MVCLKQNKPKQSLDVATNALKVDSTNVKALYRRAAVHRRLVTEVKDLSGDASVAFSRGKKRYVFDFHCTLKYNILDKDTDDVLASGTINLPDISSTSIDDELEIEISSWKKAPNASSLASITECRQLLVTQIRLQVLAFVSEFNRQY